MHCDRNCAVLRKPYQRVRQGNPSAADPTANLRWGKSSIESSLVRFGPRASSDAVTVTPLTDSNEREDGEQGPRRLGPIVQKMIPETLEADRSKSHAKPPRPEDREKPAVAARTPPPKSERTSSPERSPATDRDRVRANRPIPIRPDATDVPPERGLIQDVAHEEAPADAASRRRERTRPTVAAGEPARTREAVPTAPVEDAEPRPAQPRPRQRPILQAAPSEDPTPAPPPPPADAAPGSVVPLVIESSAFGRSPWWSRGWWQLPPGGHARDMTCDAGTSGSLATIAASLRGNKHRVDGTANDDAFAIRVGSSTDGSEWVVGCVCDGVGSAARAHEGSAFVAEQVADALADLCASPAWVPDETAGASIVAAVANVRAALTRHFALAADDPESVRAFETTLTFAMVRTTVGADGARPALLGYIGDSPALLLRDGSWSDLFAAGADESTGVTSTRTAGALTYAGLEGLRAISLASDDVIMLCSDGIGSFVTNGERDLQLGQVLAERVARPVDVLEAVNLLAFDMRSADDDRTALIVWQLPDRERPAEEADG